ncbi:MAG: threonine ammonia-lyase [Chitinophagaceae bacterium]|nr:threonine ammonia-lyase [Chitinophagaceae bacterium]
MEAFVQTALDFTAARARMQGVVRKTPLTYSSTLSKKYHANVYLKREDLQVVRSYKLRGAYNLMCSLSAEHMEKGAVCASAGNHAQGFAYSCKALGIRGVIFMPVITPKQKIKQTTMFGDGCVEIVLSGDTFDDCATAARAYAAANHMVFVPPFDHPAIIEGQATVAAEVLEELPQFDYLFVPVGGGGLAAGMGSFCATFAPATKVVGVEPAGAPSMKTALEKGFPVTLDQIDRFVDGAAVKRVGELTFQYCKEVLHDMLLVQEGAVCSTILNLYNEDAIVVEPAGALSITALEQYADKIAGKTVVCVVSGSNNDIDRMQEIKERSLQHEGLKHYFLISFAQRPGALKDFVNNVLGPGDDITRFEYMQKHNKETGPALVGIELGRKEDYPALLKRMQNQQVDFTEINKQDKLFAYLV